MAVQAWKRRLACLWSVELLFPSLEECEFWPGRRGLPHTFKDTGYLWTFTFPDARGQSDLVYASGCWRKFQNGFIRRKEWRGVRALERGFRSGHYHFHVVTDQRWPIEEVLAASSAAGFGRVNVEEVPRERLRYVAKYVGKISGRWKIPAGVRLWACFGFKGVRTNGIRFREKTLTVMPDFIEYPYRRSVSWFVDGQKVSTRVLVAEPLPGAEYRDHEMNITKENGLHLVNLLASGSMLAVGEYRTCTARVLNFKDEDTGKEKSRKLVEHGIEVGDSQMTVTEWLPDTADIATVKPPVTKGEPCVVEIDAFSKKYGITAKSIKSLASFNGKLA